MAKIPRELTLELGLDEADGDEALRTRIAQKLRMPEGSLPEVRLKRRSIDARRGAVRFHLVVELGPSPGKELGAPHPIEVRGRPPVVIVGDGPAGLFCAYQLARRGIASIVVDRGKWVQPRRRDLAGLNRQGIVSEDSNYCFGEGGAGTYSDGKLYTRSDKRGDVRDVIEVLALHGAPDRILVDARPHIGSNKLPKVVTAMRTRLEAVGVEFRFGARMVEVLTVGSGTARRVRGIRLANGDAIETDTVVLATGHSAADVLRGLHALGVRLEPKPFAMGVRIEHPQPLINRIQYGAAAGHPRLPNAYYRIAETVDARGVFSFCMCPGGWIVPASTEPGGLVLNGMSLAKRNSPFANSGLVVSVDLADVAKAGLTFPLGGIELQRRLEQVAFTAGGGELRAPATRTTDYLRRRGSTTVPEGSYVPGFTASDVGEVLDAIGIDLGRRLREALRAFDRRLPGYVTEEAVLVGVETRTSSPVRVPRDPETYQSPDLRGLYPCGEGAGYAGGIVSAALDGINVATRIEHARGATGESKRSRVKPA